MRRLFYVLLVLWLASLPLRAQRWDAAVALGNGWNNHDMVFDTARGIHLVWAGATYLNSPDNGVTWSAPRRLVPPGAGQIGNPDIAIDQLGNLYVVFEYKLTGTPAHQLYLVKSSDLGATWTVPVRIGFTAKFSAWPKIEVDTLNRIHVLWQDKCNLHNWSEPPLPGCSGTDFYHTASSDGGLTWSQSLIVSGSDSWTLHSAVDRSGGIYGFWSFSPGPGQPRGVYMYRSLDGGLTWDRQFVGNGNEQAAAIDADGAVHVAFSTRSSPTHFALRYRKGENHGQTWGPITVLAEQESGNSGFNPAAWCTIAADPKNNVIAAFQSGSSGNFEIYALRSPNGGKTWQKLENLSQSSYPSLQPDLFIDAGSTAHVVWTEAKPGFVIHYRRGPLRGQ